MGMRLGHGVLQSKAGRVTERSASAASLLALAIARARGATRQVMSDVPGMRAHGATHGPGIYLARRVELAYRYAHAARASTSALGAAVPAAGGERGDGPGVVAWEQGGWRCIGLCEVSPPGRPPVLLPCLNLLRYHWQTRARAGAQERGWICACLSRAWIPGRPPAV